ncbi:hypothetical protein [Streptomyces cavernae]|uniref:hypothetical protein n=1 Tax=Streptomyces cavernae TaxID=2259034 RepID=UPI000FEBE187|nr:hypothetical protein [Streptomyces cavernae]
MKTLMGRATAAAGLGLALTAGVGVSAIAPQASAADTFNQPITCKKADVRTKPNGKGKHVMYVYQKGADYGHITKSWLDKNDNISYWWGTWHHGKTAKKGWVKLACADPRAV